MRNLMLIPLVALFGMSASFAEVQAVLKDIKGKVEVRTINATAWIAATEGMTISTMTTVSTGFDSSVTVEMDKNALFVKPLTRMTIDKLIEEQGKRSTNCYLRVGSVKASVKTSEGVKQDFKVQSPYSTASVRGTQFVFSALGLDVSEGLVALIPGRPQREPQMPEGTEAAAPDLSDDFAGAPEKPAVEGQELMVGAGTSAEISVNPDGSLRERTSSDRDALKESSTVTMSDSGSAAADATRTPVTTAQYGSVTITVRLPAAQ
jgi:hypothetical protein